LEKKGGMVFVTARNAMKSVFSQLGTKPTRTYKIKKKVAHIFVTVVVVTGGLALESTAPVLAEHRDVGDGECSWFPDKVLPVYDFHDACVNHDACGERIERQRQLSQDHWDYCDRELWKDAKSWCVEEHPSWSPLLGKCLDVADGMYSGLRGFANVFGNDERH
jgi:hypothetical protein